LRAGERTRGGKVSFKAGVQGRFFEKRERSERPDVRETLVGLAGILAYGSIRH